MGAAGFAESGTNSLVRGWFNDFSFAFAGHSRPWLVLTSRTVDAGLAQHQPLNGLSSNDVRVDDLVHIAECHAAVPDPFRINYQVRTVLALVQTAGLIGSNFSLQSALCQFLLEQFLQFRLSGRITASARMSGRSLVSADENVSFKLGHSENLQDLDRVCGQSVPGCVLDLVVL